MGIKITHEKISDWILAGYGQGHGAEYISWLQLGRGRFIPKSRHGWYIDPTTGAQQTIFSDNERNAGIAGIWLGASEGRFQFPCFTFQHPHPLDDAPGREAKPLPWSIGTVELADEANIYHPIFPGTDIHYIPTFDILFTLPPRESPRLAGLAGKDAGQTRSNTPDWNTLKNLELQRRYAADIGAEFRTWDQLVCPPELIKNLCSVYPSAVLPVLLPCSQHYPDFLQFASAKIDYWPVRKILQEFARQSGLAVPDVTFLFDHAAWTQEIPVDLTKPVMRSSLAPLWNGQWMKEMRHAMFGCREFA